MLKLHQLLCPTNDLCKAKRSKKDSLNFKPKSYKIPVHIKIYAGIECSNSGSEAPEAYGTSDSHRVNGKTGNFCHRKPFVCGYHIESEYQKNFHRVTNILLVRFL